MLRRRFLGVFSRLDKVEFVSEGSGFQVRGDAPRHYETETKPFMEPFADALVASVVRPGDLVLDVACGTGVATRAAAAVAGESGSVTGTDINSAMLVHAEEITSDPVVTSWDEASALDLPYEDNSFDSVICQQGLQFFPDPAAGLVEMARVTKQDGRLAVTVWSELDRSPYFEALMEMLINFGGIEREAVREVFPKGILGHWIEAGGFAQHKISVVEAEVSLPPIKEYIPAHMKALPWASEFFALTEGGQRAAINYVDSRLSEFRIDSGIRVPFSSLLAKTTV